MSKFISLTILLLIAVTGSSQVLSVTRGIVLDKDSRKPVPFASVAIIGTMRGASANDQGEFTLPYHHGDEFVKISCIGYHTATFPVGDHNNDKHKIFELSPLVIQLGELEITEAKIDPQKIIKGAIDSIARNYKRDSFNIEFYSKVISKDTLTRKEGIAEFIILGYYDGYASRNRKKFHLVRKRMTGDNPMETHGVELWPTFEIHTADLIADPEKSGIFSPDNLDKFNFTYNGIKVYDGDTVYHISYDAPKPTKKITRFGIVPKVYRGEVYITIDRYAVVRHDIITDRFRYSTIYKKIADWYFPYLITGDRRFGPGGLLTAANFASMRSVSFQNVTIIHSPTNERDDLDNIPDDPEFWLENYPLLKDN